MAKMRAEQNAARYHELSTPFEGREAASEAMEAFVDDVLAARVKHRIPDLVMCLQFSYSDEAGEVTPLVLALNYGSSVNAEPLAAYAYGKFRAERASTVERILKEASKP